MTNKTNPTLFAAILFLCIPTTHAMQHNVAATSSISAPTQALSPYERLEQLKAEETNALSKLLQKKAEFDKKSCFYCLTNETAGQCAGGAAGVAIVSIAPHAFFPDLTSECESACNAPHGSTRLCSIITSIAFSACLFSNLWSRGRATSEERSEYEAKCILVELQLDEICDAAERERAFKRNVKKAD